MAEKQLNITHQFVNLRRLGLRLLAIFGLLAFSVAAQAQDCSDYPNGVIDGAVGDIPPSQLQIDRNCTIRNFPADNPLSTNFSFFTQPGQTNERWLITRFWNTKSGSRMAHRARFASVARIF
jgi:hypothetical protein